ncbi:hypothetical protein WJ96_04525 [Burkholderia ubonensis]|uniref:Uncharacterized protein n=1 Tax=Burkholderia ubonensis TaxID=101571 RepID=A0AAW3N1G6_9BURK|nr:hypothetical protein [Burkholderia ubonensis]KVP65638.1 hypothetical protein WJ93_24260 [Burkholderia ubonensis]KVP97841.1 hypothetical protein WJ96_04525 [Burkholderia ubonensis]KVZ92538.1 hypothetical protein WL25_16180 [Burkholderia ubonensis]
MAKLKPIDFKFAAIAGEPLIFRSEVTVSDSDGAFALTIPDLLEEVANQVLSSHGKLYGVQVTRPRTNLRVEGAVLESCKRFIEHLAKDFLHCDVKEELVIVYGVSNKVAYVKDDAGHLYENGYACRDQYVNRTARWRGTLNATTGSSYYQVGMAARVFKKLTYTRSSGQSVKYARVDGDDTQPWLSRLNSFVGLSLSSSDERTLSRMDQMPYSEDAARFFYNSMMAMCQLADRIDAFFGDRAVLQQAIEGQAPLLLPAA